MGRWPCWTLVQLDSWPLGVMSLDGFGWLLAESSDPKRRGRDCGIAHVPANREVGKCLHMWLCFG